MQIGLLLMFFGYWNMKCKEYMKKYVMCYNYSNLQKKQTQQMQNSICRNTNYCIYMYIYMFVYLEKLNYMF